MSGQSEPAGTPSISLCCLTAGPLHRVGAILSLYRPVVDEIVVAVNGRFARDELACLEGVADKVVPVEMRADFLQERYRAWLYSLCEGDRVVTVDSDEVPSVALLSGLREMAAAPDVVTFLTSCRWLYPDGGHYLDEYPWEPSWKMVMVRNDPATLHIKGGVHEGVMAVEPYRFVERPVYHLSCVTTTERERAGKVAFYDGLDGRQSLEDGRPVSEVFYLPEQSSRYAPGTLPEPDAALVERVLRADTSRDRILERESVPAEASPLVDLLEGTVSYETVLATWPERPLSEGAYEAKIELRRGRSPKRDLHDLEAGEVRPMMVAVTNLGDETWLRAMRNRIALSYRWFSTDRADAGARAGAGRELVLEGGRAGFASDVHPGEEILQPIDVTAPKGPGTYLLVVDLVEESVRWFDRGLERTAVVTQP